MINLGRNLSPEQIKQALMSVDFSAPSKNAEIEEIVKGSISSGLDSLRQGNESQLKAVATAIAQAIQETMARNGQSMDALAKEIAKSLKDVDSKHDAKLSQTLKDMEGRIGEVAKAIPTIPKQKDYTPEIDKVGKRVDSEFSKILKTLVQSVAQMQSHQATAQAKHEQCQRELLERVAEMKPREIVGMKISTVNGGYDIEFLHD